MWWLVTTSAESPSTLKMMPDPARRLVSTRTTDCFTCSMMALSDGVGTGVAVGAGVGVGIGDGVAVGGGVGVDVGVGVTVGNGVAVGVGTGVGDGSAATMASTRACTVASTSGVGAGEGAASLMAAWTVAAMSGVGSGSGVGSVQAASNRTRAIALRHMEAASLRVVSTSSVGRYCRARSGQAPPRTFECVQAHSRAYRTRTSLNMVPGIP